MIEAIENLDSQNQKSTGVCLITGDICNITRLHNSIKGVKDSQPAGADIVSFNKSAFESYNKKQGDNSPIGEKAMFAYITALNELLNRRAAITVT